MSDKYADLTVLFRTQRLPHPNRVAAGGKTIARALPHPDRCTVDKDGLAHGWGGDDVVLHPPKEQLFKWLEKGMREAKSMLACMPLDAIMQNTSFWRDHKPRLVAFGADRLWVFWSVDGTLRAPQPGMATLGWLDD